MSYNVYTIERLDLSSPKHAVIFVETEKDAGGLIFEVTGSILHGTKYEKTASGRPDKSASFVPGSQRLIGSLEKSKLAAFESACAAVPVPGAQVQVNSTSTDHLKPIQRCGEWVEEVKAKAIAEGILLVGRTKGEWLVLL
ncbi:hypothetical protein CERZMDRAFT_82168 [Cercospora zeae-maydis SCOH1-5]|uniref:Uncharacterized protein n=1 Tax=Cercospora zeae-maydis SCOH1-5 TaxID=717836 RepID=A0A6A6FNQ6_9PEZI|nr:hypothetical protein CERZMDRAFT_82168 [Cercospora zeae-maydis SCOH1-5]